MDYYERKHYDDFYVAYFDSRGRVIYPSDPEEVKVIQSLIKNTSFNSMIYIEERNLYYKLRIKRKIIDGEKIQIIEISNVTEFLHQVSQASVDEVTHLNNRKIAWSLFSQYINQAVDNKEKFAIILADLDGFKEVNDKYGHTNGDTVLSEVSRILYCSTRQESWREQDIVARIGGDEFVVIMKNIEKNIALNRAEKIRNLVQEHKVALFNQNGEESYITAGTLSIGLYHVDNNDLEELLNKGYDIEEVRKIITDRCDSALYNSKNNGKNRITTYEKERTLQLKK